MANTLTLVSIVRIVVAFLMAITFHEFCHALAAYALGDDTAKKAGRLTLNPFAHIDLIGLLFLILFRIGWAKPVPIDPRNFKYPRVYSVLVALAGPFANFLLAYICLLLVYHGVWHYAGSYVGEMTVFLRDSVWINTMLGVFNMLPIPPLDGSRIIEAFVPEQFKYAYYRFQQYSFILLIILLAVPAFNRFLFSAIKWAQHFLWLHVF